MEKNNSKRGIYLHIPFCKSRCSYCDFATDVYRSSDAVERYVAAICKEIEAASLIFKRSAETTGRNASVNERVSNAGGTLVDTRVSARDIQPQISCDTIYFGGGTPSLLTAKQVERILLAVHDEFDVRADAEITMEMNPATVSLETLKDYRSLGVNRASFGVQTFNDHALKLLARGHDANDARDTFRLLREAGYENISFDLIAGLPGQTLRDWERNLDEALKMQPEHLSLYLLEIHEGTPLGEQIRSRRQPMPDGELAAEMYELMLDKVTAAGYEQYEISNFSRPDFESRHNSKYWRLEPVYGFGVSAHSFDGTQRYANERDTAKYISHIEESKSAEVMREEIDAASEYVFLGLRLTPGVDLKDYENRFGVNLVQKYQPELNRFRESGLVEISDNQLNLTRKGMLFSNEVFTSFV